MTEPVASPAPDTATQDLLDWLDSQRRHVAQQVAAMPPEARRRSVLPSGWTPRGLLTHLALDVERVWLRAVMGGQDVALPAGHEGWTAPDGPSDDELLDRYAEECRLASAAVAALPLDAAPVWWFADAGDPPYGTLREVLMHVVIETATHAGHLDVVRELADGGQRLVLDEPPS